MSTVSDRIKDRLDTAKTQIEGFEKQVGREFNRLEQRAKESLDEVPAQLKGAWENVVDRLRSGLRVATREELRGVSDRVDQLAKKLDQLLRSDRSKTHKKS